VPVASGIYYSVHEGAANQGLPVVLIHGAGGTQLAWPPEVRRLSGGRIFAVDLPGHGKSAVAGGQQSIAGYARLLLSWMDAVQLPRAVFVGHSMGGAIALTMAIHHSQQTLGIGLVGSGPTLPVDPRLLEYAASPTTFFKAVEAFQASAYSPSAAPRLVELAMQRLAETRPSVLHGDLLASSKFDASAHLAQAVCPALIVCGQDDRLTPPRWSQFMAGALPQARLALIPQAGHMVMLEQPEVVARALIGFLREIPFNPGEVTLHVHRH